MITVIVTLGAPNTENGSLSPIAQSRLDRAAEEFFTRQGPYILPTGGFGAHFNLSPLPHYEYSRRYLAAKGIPEDRILPGVPSRNTVQDAFLSARALRDWRIGELVVVTSDFHGARAGFLFSLAFPGIKLELRLAEAVLAEDERAETERHEQASLAAMRREGVYFEGHLYRPF